MKNLILLAVSLILVLAPAVAGAGTEALKTRTARGYDHLLCVAEGTGFCDQGGTPDYYVNVSEYESVTFIMDSSTAGADCDIHGFSGRQDVPGTADLSSFSTTAIGNLLFAAPNVTIANNDYKYMAVTCGNASGAPNVWVLGSQGRRRK